MTHTNWVVNKPPLLFRVPDTASVLEIGPFDRPLLRGENVRYFDILSSEGLKDRAKSVQDRVPENVPDVIHYVSSTGDLKIIPDRFDFVISSHMIEHSLDFVEHLQLASNLLHENGRYFCVVPDKRYCFDHYQNLTTIADVLDAHYCKLPGRHSLRSLLEHRALQTHNNPVLHWAGQSGDCTENQIQRIKAAIEEFRTNPGYIDVHKWYFTPQVFVNIVRILNELELTELVCAELYETPRNALEFAAVLARNPRGAAEKIRTVCYRFEQGSKLEQGIRAFNQEDRPTAVECLSEAMKEEPDNPLPYAYLAFVCAQQGLNAEARDFINQAIRLAPQRADLIAGLGEVFLKQGKPSEAVEYLREAVLMQPDLFSAYPALAQSLHMTGQSEEAILLLQAAANLPSDAKDAIRDLLRQIRAEYEGS
ncbi:MAG: tetratricopeptide repeat protein [Zoogloeaceae bacterium]|nr:tetratricopeptide repeat protein [Zoogloeaceae bacterium]